ncbi:MAG TPA: hypothetical protein GX528_05880 [Firmicutes bacterium]|nr:hypothetical protein [Bacillota bacterium]
MLRQVLASIVGAGKILGALAWQAPNLIIQKRRAASRFQAQLKALGLDEEAVEVLTKAYLDLGSTKNWFGGIDEDAE